MPEPPTVDAGHVRRFDDRLAGRAAHRGDPRFAALAASRFRNPEIRWAPEVAVHCRGVPDVV
ncbi:MAG: hypothetical protein JWR63_3930, partial [Conexibacter sp.]|nr:hypothetical protein [Conexibacter sp.]